MDFFSSLLGAKMISGESSIKDDDTARRIVRYTEAIARGGPAHIYVKLAETFRRSGRIQDAVDAAREGLSRYPDSLLIKEVLGLGLIDQGDAENAVRSLAPVVEKLPDNGVAAVALAMALTRVQRLTDAAKVLKRRLVRDPFDQKSRNLLRRLEEGDPLHASTLKRETITATQAPDEALRKNGDTDTLEEVAGAADAVLKALGPVSETQTGFGFVFRSAGDVFDRDTAVEADEIMDFDTVFDEKSRLQETSELDGGTSEAIGEGNSGDAREQEPSRISRAKDAKNAGRARDSGEKASSTRGFLRKLLGGRSDKSAGSSEGDEG